MEDAYYFEVIPETVCQWTGEYDSNEVEIYEKDIWTDGRKNYKFVITDLEIYEKDIWTDGRKNYKFVITDLELYYWAKFDDQMHHNFESGCVIGNVIDNPELAGD